MFTAVFLLARKVRWALPVSNRPISFSFYSLRFKQVISLFFLPLISHFIFLLAQKIDGKALCMLAKEGCQICLQPVALKLLDISYILNAGARYK